MNIPTRLTVFRMIATPFFLIFFFLPIELSRQMGPALSPSALQTLSVVSAWLLLALAFLSELTDLLDGAIARKYHQVTDLGKVLDPFSDVILHVTYFICFTFVGLMPVWALTVIIYRELGITMVRMLSMKEGIAIPANRWGKAKTALYAATGFMGLFYVLVDRLFAGGVHSGLQDSVLAGASFVCENGCLLRNAVLAYGQPVLAAAFSLAAGVSVISFLTYVIPFAKSYRQNN